MSFLRGKFDLDEPPIDDRRTNENSDGKNSGIWQYGDEASLYSIAEDSREDRMSISSVGLAAKDALKGNAWVFGSFWPQPQSEVPPPTQRDENGGFYDGTSRGSSMPSAIGVELSIEDGRETPKSGDEIFLYYPERRRRRFRILCGTCFLCTLIVATVLVVVLKFGDHFGDQDLHTQMAASREAPPGSMAAEENDEGPEGQDEVSEDKDTKYLLSQNYVFNSLTVCPGFSTVFDTTTNEGRVFAGLVDEVYSGASDDTSGSVSFDFLHSETYLRERFSLEVLYHTTLGDMWKRNDGWMSGGDPCDGWAGVECESERTIGSCAVTALNLDNNGLSGHLPDALCCLPCVDHIGMADNSIGGPILTCLAQMQSLRSISFENNRFGTAPVNSAESNTVVVTRLSTSP